MSQSQASNKSLLELSKMRSNQASINSNSKPTSNSPKNGLNTVVSAAVEEISLIRGQLTKEPTEYILPKKDSEVEKLKLPAVKQAKAFDKEERNSLHSNSSSNSRLLKPSNTKNLGASTNNLATKEKADSKSGPSKSQSQPPSSINGSRAKYDTESTASLSIHLADTPSESDRNSPKKTEFLNENSTKTARKEATKQTNPDNKPNEKPDYTARPNGNPELITKQNDKQGATPSKNSKPETNKNLKPESTSRPAGKPEPSPRPNGKSEPPAKQNGKPEPSPRPSGKPEPSPRPNGKSEPPAKQNGKPEPSPRTNARPEPIPRDKAANNKAPGKPGKEEDDMKSRNNQASMARNPTGTYTDQHNSTNPNPVKNYDPKVAAAAAKAAIDPTNPFGMHPWAHPWAYHGMHPWVHPHPVAYPPDPSALHNYHMNLWMKPFVQDWQQGKNNEELPFYFGLENSSYIHKWKTTDEGKQAMAKVEAKEAKEKVKQEKAEKAEQLKREKAEKARLAEEKKKEKAEKLAKEKEMDAETIGKEKERAAKEVEAKAKDAVDKLKQEKAKAEAEKLEKAELSKKEKEAKAKEAAAKKAEADAKAKESAEKGKFKDMDLTAKGAVNKSATEAKGVPNNPVPNKPTNEAKGAPNNPVPNKPTNEAKGVPNNPVPNKPTNEAKGVPKNPVPNKQTNEAKGVPNNPVPNKPATESKDGSKQNKLEEKKDPEAKQGTVLPVIKKASNEPAKKGPAIQKTSDVVVLPKDINKKLLDSRSTPNLANKPTDPKKSNNLPVEATKNNANIKNNTNAKSLNEVNQNPQPTPVAIKPGKSLNIATKFATIAVSKEGVQAQPIKS